MTSKQILPIALFLCACGDDAEPAATEDPSEHACEHVAEEGQAITAATSAAEAPELALSEEPYTVTLAPGEPGYVKLESPAEALLFAGSADVVSGLTLDGEDIALPGASPNEFCASEIPEHYDLDLDESGAYVLRLGPVGIGSVWLTYTAAAGHAH